MKEKMKRTTTCCPPDDSPTPCEPCSTGCEEIECPTVPLCATEFCSALQELVDNLDCCNSENSDCITAPCVLSETAKLEYELEIINNLVELGRCKKSGFYKFDSCVEMADYKGSCLCPLKVGDIAVVTRSNGCFDFYIYSESESDSSSGSCSPGEVVSSTHCHSRVWKPYSACLPTGTDTYINDFKITKDGNVHTLVITRSDGTTYTQEITIPTQSSSGESKHQNFQKSWNFPLTSFSEAPNYREIEVPEPMTADHTGLYTIYVTSYARIKCNSSVSDALVLPDHAIYINGERVSAWVQFAHIERYAPSHDADKGDSSSFTHSFSLSEGQVVSIRLRFRYSGPKPSKMRGAVNWGAVLVRQA